MKKLFLFIAALFTATVMHLQAAEAVSYLYPEYNTSGDPTSGIKEWKTGSCAEYTVVENCTTAVAWNAGWYVVKGTSVEITQAITCSDAVHLILADGAQLTAKKGIKVSEDANSITIYGQSNQTGTLIATGGSRAAGIGGSGRYGKNITINGGKVTATGGSQAAGIGGGRLDYGQNITINGGTVTATGGQSAAGIGGGDSGWGSNITINGGTLTATGGKAAAGIGGGSSSSGLDITINGGTVNANGGLGSAGIGGGINNNGSNITISGGIVTATGGGKAAGIGGGSASSSGNGNGSDITISGGIVTATGGEEASGIGGGCYGNCSNITISGGTVTAIGGANGIGKGVDGSTASNIFVNPSLILKADGNNPPTTVIAHATITTDVASLLAGQRYATAEPTPDMHDFLHFVSLNGNDTVRLNKYANSDKNLAKLTATFEYSKDRINWTEYTWGTYGTPVSKTALGAAIALNQGDTIFFRAKGTNGKNATMGASTTAHIFFAFGADDSIAAGGNVMSLYDAKCEQDTMTAYGFISLFTNAKQLVSVSELKLPATKLEAYCYGFMFQNCTALTQTPELKATKLKAYCYYGMFYGCNALTSAPELKATTLANSCYSAMFQGCTSLEVDTCTGSCDGVKFEPTHSGTAIAGWNQNMFKGCKGTVTTPQLGGHYCIKEYKEPDMHDMLHFVSLKDNGTVKLNKTAWDGDYLPGLTATFEYSKDRKTWTAYDTWGEATYVEASYSFIASGNSIALNQGDTVFFRAKGTNGKNATISDNGGDVAFFQFAFGENDSIAAGGNVMSLYDASCEQNTMTVNGFYFLFYDAKQLVSAPKLSATTLANYCYMDMFYGCTGLTSAPALPATTLTHSCYCGMFESCTALTKAPELKTTALAENCYSSMFKNCTSLTQAPELKATELVENCYAYMFQGCTALTQAPELKATTLAPVCYLKMFNGCSSLEINAFSESCDGAELVVPTTGAINWNKNMFTGCKGDAALTAETGIQLGGHYCIKEYKDTNDYLHFVGLNGNDTVRLNKWSDAAQYLPNLTATFEYSKDRKIWTEYTWGTDSKTGSAIALENAGDTVFFRAKGTNGKNATMSSGSSAYFIFAFGADDSIAAGGNAMSLYDATCEQDTMTAYGFYRLFQNAKQLVSAPKLPAKQMADHSYGTMFQSCTSLVTAPKLPATTLNNGCYMGMFLFCSSLTQAPELPADTLAKYCYNNMFKNCTSLTQAPELKATTLAGRCYASMFDGCTSLIVAPELKATTLDLGCYDKMFSGCTSLEVDTCADGSCDGAELVVPTTGATNWNLNMFDGCKGEAKYTAEHGIKLGGHYCIKEYVPIQIVVVYNLQGHGEAIKNDTIISGNKLTQPAKPTAQGYEFRNWYTDAQSMGEKFDFSKTITASQDTVITLYAKWRDPAAWEQFQKDLNKYSYVEYDSTYTTGFRVHLATTENAQVQEVTTFPIIPLMGNPFIEVSADVLSNYDLQTLETTIISLRPALTDEIKKCMGIEETTENVMLKLIASYTQLPYRVSGLYAVGMLFSSYVDLAYKTWVETNYENDADICKCMLNSDYFFKASAKCIEALQAGEK